DRGEPARTAHSAPTGRGPVLARELHDHRTDVKAGDECVVQSSLRERVSDGFSPCRAWYSDAKRPRWWKPKRRAVSATLLLAEESRRVSATRSNRTALRYCIGEIPNSSRNASCRDLPLTPA